MECLNKFEETSEQYDSSLYSIVQYEVRYIDQHRLAIIIMLFDQFTESVENISL